MPLRAVRKNLFHSSHLASGAFLVFLDLFLGLSSISAFALVASLEKPGGSTGFAELRGPRHTHARLPQPQHHSGRVSLLSGTALCPLHSARNWQSESRGPSRAPCATPGNSLPLSEPQSSCLEKGSGADGYLPSFFPGRAKGKHEMVVSRLQGMGDAGRAPTAGLLP